MRPRPAGPLTLVSHGLCLSFAVSYTANARILMGRRPTTFTSFFLSHGRLHGKLVVHASTPHLPSQALSLTPFLVYENHSYRKLSIKSHYRTLCYHHAMLFPSNLKSMGLTGCGYFLLLLSKTHQRSVYSFPRDKANALQKRSM